MWPFNSQSNDTEPEPPEDEGKETSREWTLFVYEITFEYENGDTETVEAYDYHRGKHAFTYDVTPKPSAASFSHHPQLRFTSRSVNYETLTREPIVSEPIREETWRVTTTLEYIHITRGGRGGRWEKRAGDVRAEQVD